MNSNGSLFRSNAENSYKVITAEVNNLKNFNEGSPIALSGPGLDGNGTAVLGQMDKIECNEIYGNDGDKCMTLNNGMVTFENTPGLPGVVIYDTQNAVVSPNFSFTVADGFTTRVTFAGLATGMTPTGHIGFKCFNAAGNQIGTQFLMTATDGGSTTQTILQGSPLLGQSINLCGSLSNWSGLQMLLEMTVSHMTGLRSTINYKMSWRNSANVLCICEGSIGVVSGLRSIRFITENAGGNPHGDWDIRSIAKIEHLNPV